MKIIKTENFVSKNKTYTVKVWKDSNELTVQAFHEAIPVSYRFVMDIIQLDDMRMYYSADPIEMMIKHVKRFVEECNRLGIDLLRQPKKSK